MFFPIVGGTATQAGDYPTVVEVVYQGTNSTYFCGGTLVSPHLVLTASSCLDPQMLGLPDQQAVTAGTTVTIDALGPSSGTQVAVAQTMIAPGHSLGAHDIGAVILANPITDRSFSPIAASTASVIGQTFTLVGYGGTDAQGTGVGTERAGSATAVACASNGNDANLVCFDATAGASSCGGDGGSPAFDASGTLVGISSFGDLNCQVFGAYTRVSAEGAFIASALTAAGDASDPDAGVGPDAGNGEMGGGAGCCDTGGGGGAGAIVLAAAVIATRRRR